VAVLAAALRVSSDYVGRCEFSLIQPSDIGLR
jgi:hypothetical protein